MSRENTQKSYDFLKRRFAQITNIDNASGILYKDAETVMAAGSGNDRINQQIALGEAAHMLIADPRVEDALNQAEEGKKSLPPQDRRNLALMRHQWLHTAGLPEDLSREISHVSAAGEQLHVTHYKSGNWDKVKAHYERSFNALREAGQFKKDVLGKDSVYDALVDQFSPGITVAQINNTFGELDQALRLMIPQAMDKQARQDPPLPLKPPFPAQQQEIFSRHVLSLTGFDQKRGVLYAIKGHPSSGGSPDDSRITTRIDESDPLFGLLSTLHEAGHGIYEQNLPKKWRYQPAGSSQGMDVHESQSMIYELQAALSDDYLTWLAQQLRDTFNRHNDPALATDNVLRAVRQVKPSFIRIAADEMTYPMHVILRYELERDIIEGALRVRDLPDAWNEKMQEKLGVTPPDPSQGCMQDVHWPTGAVGYFPSYTLGAMGAAQFFAAATKQQPAIIDALKEGSFIPLRQWLTKNVHSKGSLVESETLFKKATGRPLETTDFLRLRTY